MASCVVIGQELQYYREKSAIEIADLESVAQAHYSRANRLSEELDYLRSEHSQLKSQVSDILARSQNKLSYVMDCEVICSSVSLQDWYSIGVDNREGNVCDQSH